MLSNMPIVNEDLQEQQQMSFMEQMEEHHAEQDQVSSKGNTRPVSTNEGSPYLRTEETMFVKHLNQSQMTKYLSPDQQHYTIHPVKFNSNQNVN